MRNLITMLKIEHLEGGGYNIDSIIKAIQTFSEVPTNVIMVYNSEY